MTKTKKLIARIASIAASAIFCTAAVTSVPASALSDIIDKSSEYYQDLMERVYEVDDSGLFSNFFKKTYKIYTGKQSQFSYSFFVLEECAPQFEFTVENSSENETVNMILNSINPDYKVLSHIDSDGNTKYTVFDEKFDSETIKNTRAVCEELKEKDLIQDFYYCIDMTERRDMEYSTEYSVEDDETISALKKCVEENGFDCVVSAENSVCRVVPNSEIAPEEYFALAKKIYDELGLWGSCMTLEIAYYPYATIVDMFNAVYGDATNDSNIDLYDAIEISKGIMGMRTFNDKEKVIADYDGDGEVDLYDAIGIAKHIMNIK